ncbi:MAG: hypothetical protein HYZ17_12050 [Betaproteobacteria bacterium]|nr:hypothetical protein [Betaproteobacteria bacterium]
MTDPTPSNSGTPPAAENPYAPPAFPQMAAPPKGEPGFLAEGRQVPAGNGASWLGGGWALFKEAPGMWILFTIIIIAISLVLSLLPVIGDVAMTLLSPVLWGGIMLGCVALKQGEPLELSHLFAGFTSKAGPLVLLGLLSLVGTVVIVLIIGVVAIAIVGGTGLATLLRGDGIETLAGLGGMLLGLLLAGLLFLVLLIPLMMALWFATPLVVFQNLDPLAAMRASFKVCLKNIGAFLIYGLLGLVLAIVASIPILLGWLVLVPVIMGSIYAGYRDVFFENP